MKLTIWTEAYRPFLMGGDCNAPISTEVDTVDPPIDLGHGIEVYVITSPSGTCHIVEATTGALIGTDIDSVRRDVESADTEVMQRQIAEASERKIKANPVNEDQFWRLLENRRVYLR